MPAVMLEQMLYVVQTMSIAVQVDTHVIKQTTFA
jgi:hypothetical protein